MPTIAQYNKRLEALKSERSSFMSVWRQLSDYHLAYRGRFLTSDRNKGYRRETKQINNHSRRAARTLASGMMAGITSPARPWFRLSTLDPDLKDRAPVMLWLHQVQQIMYAVFSQSNLYNSLSAAYEELGVFGCGPIGLFDDFDAVIWTKPYTVGSYYMGLDGKGIVDTFYREYELPVAQVVKQFGIENCSQPVQEQWRRGNTEAWVRIVHAIEPNDDRDTASPLARDKAFRSVYYEAGRKATDTNQFLRRSGFDTFPVLCPRWDVVGEDVYATDCPGMTALGDAKALQLGERKMYGALGKIVDPPLQAPASMQSKIGDSLRDGEIVWTTGNDKIESVYNFNPNLGAMVDINRRVEDRIDQTFYVDLFLMLSNTDRRQITAREVAEKHEEKLLMLGPVLERLHNEMLDPLIDRTFRLLQDGGVLPPPPPELEETELRVEYVSVLAQAQQMVSVGAIERYTGFAAQLASVWPEARHKVDPLQAMDDYAESLGVPPQVVQSDDAVQAAVNAERQAAQLQQQAAMAQQAAATAKDVDSLDEEGAMAAGLRNAGLM